MPRHAVTQGTHASLCACHMGVCVGVFRQVPWPQGKVVRLGGAPSDAEDFENCPFFPPVLKHFASPSNSESSGR